MFTGIIQSVGEVASSSGRRLAVRIPDSRGRIGDSLAVNGICLTITRQQGRPPRRVAFFDVSPETRKRTTLADLRPGTRVNLEHPLRLSDELGGHLVQGHVDGTGRVMEIQPDSTGGQIMWLSAPAEVSRYLVPKGSVAVDGVSLTVVKAGRGRFSVALIPHTLSHSNLGRLKKGDPVNLEADLFAKYAAKLGRRS